jgi:UDP-glucose 4-epimerase
MAIYLVTGGAGFIGTNITRELVRRGDTVRVLDNLSTGSRDNLADVMDQIEFIEGDICDLDAVTQAVAGADYVLHQAALRAVERSVDNPRNTNDVNITGTLNVLLAARDARVKRIVFASSSSVYGNVEVERNIETLPTQPASPYALSKLTGEHYCRIFSELFGLPTVSLRYFNVFGPYQNPESKYSAVIPIFVDSLLRGVAPEIHSDGNQSRDFTYVKNVVDANLAAAVSSVTGGEAYNIGNGENVSINDLYEQLQDLLGIHISPHRTARRAGDVVKTYADISKAKRDFGYEPRLSFKDGLIQSIAWYKEHR